MVNVDTKASELSVTRGWIRVAVLALLMAILLTPDMGAAAQPDAWVTTKTKIAIINAEGLDDTSINVDTVSGRVTLHGKVQADSQKQLAEKVARGIAGVKEVKNLLQVVPESQAKRVERTDDKIKNDVQRALKQDRALGSSDITVQSVTQGVVLLSGEAFSMTDHLRALEIARDVDGVREVSSSVEAPDELTDAQVFREEKGKKQNRDTASDLRITTQTKLKLLAKDNVPALAINVDTTEGVVTLFGQVPTEAAKRAAEKEAKSVSGVKQVKNELQVVASADEEKVEAKDEVVMTRIKDTLKGFPELEKVDVELKDGVARLTGSVSSVWHRLEAANVVRGVDGVRSVVDDLKVERENGQGKSSARAAE